MNVLPFPSGKARNHLVAFAQPPAASFDHDDLFHTDWQLNCVLNSAIALEAARRLKLQIAHLTLPPEERASRRNRQLDSGLEAKRTEPVFEYTFPSILSGDLFCEFIDQGGFANIFLVGFPANDVGIVSAIDAAKRNIDLTIVRDCSPLLAIKDCEVAASDGAIFGSIGYYANVCNVTDFVEAMRANAELASSQLPDDLSCVQPETLLYLIDRMMQQAARLCMEDCLDPLAEAARRIEPYCPGRPASQSGMHNAPSIEK